MNPAIAQMVEALAPHMTAPAYNAPAPAAPVTLVELAPPLPAPVPVAIDPEVGMGHKQLVAFRTFSELHKRAMIYRTGDVRQEDDVFDKDYGICDNIANSVPPRDELPNEGMSRSAYREMVSRIKDNIICQTPSFSGSYSYPVPHPDYLEHDDTTVRRRKAESAWDNCSDRWTGEYGLARLNQLKEMIDIIQNKWNDNYAGYMTPAMRHGIDKNSIVMIDDQEGLWKLHRDDESSDPYFQPIESKDGDGVKHFSLSYVKKIDTNGHYDKLSVPEFLERHDALLAEQAEAEKEVSRIKMLLSQAQANVNKAKSNIAVNDYFMGVQHKVRRM